MAKRYACSEVVCHLTDNLTDITVASYDTDPARMRQISNNQ